MRDPWPLVRVQPGSNSPVWLDQGGAPDDGVHREGESIFDRADRENPGWRERIWTAEELIEARKGEQRCSARKYWSDYAPGEAPAESTVIRLDSSDFRYVVDGLFEDCDSLKLEANGRGWFPWGHYTVVRDGAKVTRVMRQRDHGSD